MPIKAPFLFLKINNLIKTRLYLMSSINVGQLLFTLPVKNQLGEGVQWHHESQSIWWTDIEKSTLYKYCTMTEQLISYPMPDRVGCFAFIVNDPRLIIAFAKGIALYDLSTNQLEWLAQPEQHLASNRFNDGKVDRQGRFWAGTMVEDESAVNQQGALYVYDHCYGLRKTLSNIQISNSLCWSPDGLRMYHADSPTRAIYQYDFEPESARLSNKKLFTKTTSDRVPDGATVDAAGGVWIAQWRGSDITRYTAQGEVSVVHTLPVSQPTCIAIGGPTMDWLIITSARHNLTQSQLSTEPLAGSVFVYQLNGVKGFNDSYYQLNH